MINEKFNERLIRLRKENKMTQDMLSAMLDISTASLSHYEVGNRLPDIEVLVKMADCFNVTTDYLLCKSEYRNINDMISLFSNKHEFSNESNFSFEEFNDNEKMMIIHFSNFLISSLRDWDEKIESKYTFANKFHWIFLYSNSIFSNVGFYELRDAELNYFQNMTEEEKEKLYAKALHYSLIFKDKAIKAIQDIYEFYVDEIKKSYTLHLNKPYEHDKIEVVKHYRYKDKK